MIIVSDVDDVIANLVPYWIARYNSDWNDNLRVENISEWDISKFIKNKNNVKYLYEYLEDPNLYDEIQPIKDSLWGINTLKNMGNRVVFVTTSPINNAGKKFKWLKDHGFIDNKSDYVEAYDKSLVKGHWIIDDKPENIVNFTGKGILFSKPWNQGFNWNVRANNWKSIIKIIKSVGEFNI